MSEPARPADPAGTQPKVDPRSLESGVSTFLPAPRELPSPPSAPPAPAPPAPRHPSRSRTSPAPRPHAPRFQFLFGALGALGACAIAAVLLLLSAPKAATPAPWSAWRPLADGVDPAQQIATHVAPEYRLDNGRQIVQVSGGPPTLKGQPMTIGETRSGQQPARVEGNSVLYTMCGGGRNCSIKEGRASVQRGLLLSREALELSLYTFRYVEGADRVIVTIPPAPGTTTKHALMFRAQDVAPALSRPLNDTLSSQVPRVSQMERSADAPTVARLTGTRLYDYVTDEVPQGGAVMLLSPPTS